MILLLTFLCFPYQEWVALSFQRCSLTDYWVTRYWVWIQSRPKGGCWLPGKEGGGGEEARAGVSSCGPTCSLPRWALPLRGEHRWPGQPLMMWRKGDEGRNTVLQPSASPEQGDTREGKGVGKSERGPKDICRDGRLRSFCSCYFFILFPLLMWTLAKAMSSGFKAI